LVDDAKQQSVKRVEGHIVAIVDWSLVMTVWNYPLLTLSQPESITPVSCQTEHRYGAEFYCGGD